MNPTLNRSRIRLLYRETRWLMRLRWAAGAIVIILGAVHWLWIRRYPMGIEPILLGVAILLHNVVLGAVLKRRPSVAAGLQPLLVFGSIQIHLDLLCLTLLAIWTGGAASPVLPAYFFHMIFAALLQPRVRAYAIALTAVGGLALGLGLSGQWPSAEPAATHAIAWGITLLITIFLTDRVARSLYRREVSRTRQLERVRHLNSTIRAQQDTLVQTEKMIAMGQLAAGVAHEIANPLASMDSVLQLMQRHPDAPKPDAVATLREQVQRILRIVRQLTTYAHPGRGRLERHAINSVLLASRDLLALNPKAGKIAVECALDEHAGDARFDPHALQQVLTNLLVNALDALEARPDPRITLRTRREHAWCVIEVSDNGPGIAPDHLPRLFEPFFTTKPVGKGTGLGLSICARLVREQHGRLEVASAPGAGATFSVFLPALDPSPAADTRAGELQSVYVR